MANSKRDRKMCRGGCIWSFNHSTICVCVCFLYRTLSRSPRSIWINIRLPYARPHRFMQKHTHLQWPFVWCVFFLEPRSFISSFSTNTHDSNIAQYFFGLGANRHFLICLINGKKSKMDRVQRTTWLVFFNHSHVQHRVSTTVSHEFRWRWRLFWMYKNFADIHIYLPTIWALILSIFFSQQKKIPTFGWANGPCIHCN